MLKQHKTLVIGHSGLAGVDCMPWDAELPNIVDYDLCIVDQSTLTLEVLSKLPYRRHGEIRLLFCRLIKSDGHLVIVYDAFVQGTNVTNIDWCPVAYTVCEEAGNSISITPSEFAKYLDEAKPWERYIGAARFTRELEGMIS